METVLTELPDDREALKKLLVEQARRANKLQEEISELKLLVAEDKYEVLRRRFFSSSSEKRRKRYLST